MSTPIIMTHRVHSPIAKSGPGYFFEGFKLITTPGIRRFVIVPLLVNCVLFGFSFYQLSLYIDQFIAQLAECLPDAFMWLVNVAEPLLYFTAIICFAFIFSSVANWIAAPFNGLLAEKIEYHLAGKTIPDTSLLDVVKDVPRTLKRELSKLKHYIPRAIGFFLIMWILPFAGQVLWFMFVSWMMAIQYCDYAFDNHKVSFEEMLYRLSNHKAKCFSFGMTITLFTMIPIINFLLMPVAICGATAMWVDHLHKEP